MSPAAENDASVALTTDVDERSVSRKEDEGDPDPLKLHLHDDTSEERTGSSWTKTDSGWLMIQDQPGGLGSAERSWIS